MQGSLADSQITLPLRIAGIVSGEALADGESVATGLGRIVELVP
jgi:hypothetical protein